jgi:hypothetical protein
MESLTPKILQEYALNYDYNLTLKQAKRVLEVLDNTLGVFTIADIEMATDYVVNGEKSMFVEYFE